MERREWAVYPSLRGQVAVVTGGSRGIGRAIVEALLSQGATVAVVAINDERLADVEPELAGHVGRGICVACDVADRDEVYAACDVVRGRIGHPTLLVNCAGMVTRQPVLELSESLWHRVIDVNLSGALYMCQALIPGMIEAGGGAIVNITSQMARIPHPGASPSYEVSKAGMAALTRHLALHFARDAVRVNSVAPGTIDTGLADTMSDEAKAAILRAIPVGYMGDPNDVAAAVLFLLSEDARYVTGTTVEVTGGSLMT